MTKWDAVLDAHDAEHDAAAAETIRVGLAHIDRLAIDGGPITVEPRHVKPLPIGTCTVIWITVAALGWAAIIWAVLVAMGVD